MGLILTDQTDKMSLQFIQIHHSPVIWLRIQHGPNVSKIKHVLYMDNFSYIIQLKNRKLLLNTFSNFPFLINAMGAFK